MLVFPSRRKEEGIITLLSASSRLLAGHMSAGASLSPRQPVFSLSLSVKANFWSHSARASGICNSVIYWPSLAPGWMPSIIHLSWLGLLPDDRPSSAISLEKAPASRMGMWGGAPPQSAHKAGKKFFSSFIHCCFLTSPKYHQASSLESLRLRLRCSTHSWV